MSGRRSRDLRYRYGITEEDFAAMLTEQGDCCAICGSDDSGSTNWHVDHDNQCCPGGTKGCGNCVRSALCRSCNLLLGYARDNVIILRSAINYLHMHRANAA